MRCRARSVFVSVSGRQEKNAVTIRPEAGAYAPYRTCMYVILLRLSAPPAHQGGDADADVEWLRQAAPTQHATHPGHLRDNRLPTGTAWRLVPREGPACAAPQRVPALGPWPSEPSSFWSRQAAGPPERAGATAAVAATAPHTNADPTQTPSSQHANSSWPS